MTLDRFLPLIVEEERKLWAYLSNGSCRAINYDAEKPGVIVLDFEVADGAEAARLTGDFPLVKADLFEVEVLPLAPYQGLAALFSPDHGIAPRLPAFWQAATP